MKGGNGKTMAIRFDTVTMDEQKLPVVSWEEDRNIFAPEGIGPARVACFIRPDKESGVLMFVAAGSVRHGDFEEARPWELLLKFEQTVADQHYGSALWHAILEMFRRKNSVNGIVLTDGAHVMLATFADERASVGMHLNCASASPVEVALLHDRLRREFMDKRHNYVTDYCDGAFIWPKDKPAFKPFVLPKPVKLPAWADWLANGLVAGILALFGFGFYWFVVR